MYSAKLLAHFQNPRYAGKVPDGNVFATVENPVCGDVLELQALVSNGIIHSIRFRAKGCVPSMACGSAICRLVEGLTAPEARKITQTSLAEEVGGVPQASAHALQLALDGLRKLLDLAV
jgi:nitrogen fixation NifU-like protein